MKGFQRRETPPGTENYFEKIVSNIGMALVTGLGIC